jgi:uncharacterized protein
VLLDFSADNFRSLREEQTLDLRASAARDLAEVVRKPAGMDAESRGVLTTAAVFGANASGKSAFFMAADFMRSAVLRSADSAVEGSGVLEQLPTFRFDPVRRSAPATLRICFILAGVRYEYGFALRPRDGAHKFTSVRSEWLRSWPHGRGTDLFLRGEAARSAGGSEQDDRRWWVSEQGFHGGRRLAADLFEQTRDDVLFLSLASQRNHPSGKAVVKWFNEHLCTVGTSVRPQTQQRALADPSLLAYLGRLLRAADTGIERVEVTRDAAAETRARDQFKQIGLPFPVEAEGQFYSTRTLHRGPDGREIALDMREESTGTQRLFALAGPIHDALQHGRCLWIDELDTAMHHWLLRTLIKLFQDPRSNPNGAQLLFTTHDAAVMDPTLLRRDQIWIVEKDAAQGSQLFSLVDIEDKPRKGQPLFKSFLSGRFGGVPRLDEAAILDWPRSSP